MGRRRDSSKLPAGITIRTYASGNQVIQIAFSYRGKAYRETLDIKVTPNNIQYAANLRASIKLAIAQKNFSYATFFPESKHAATQTRTIGELATARMETLLSIGRWQRSTYTDRMKRFKNHIQPAFGDKYLSEVTPAFVRQWLESKQGLLNAQSASMALSIINPLFVDAVGEGEIERHPFAHIKASDFLSSPTTAERKKKIDPLSELEIDALAQHFQCDVDADYFTFCLFTGLRRQEAPLVKWDNIDWLKKKLYINEAVGLDGNTEFIKSTKTGEDRTIDLLLPAWEALQRQRARTQVRSEYVFLNPRTDEPYQLKALYHIWRNALRKAGLRYRSVKQTRHTFCSIMLALGKPHGWVKQQSGHTDTKMFDKHYAKWIEIGNVHHLDVDWGTVLKEAAEREEKSSI